MFLLLGPEPPQRPRAKQGHTERRGQRDPAGYGRRRAQGVRRPCGLGVCGILCSTGGGGTAAVAAHGGGVGGAHVADGAASLVAALVALRTR